MTYTIEPSYWHPGFFNLFDATGTRLGRVASGADAAALIRSLDWDPLRA